MSDHFWILCINGLIQNHRKKWNNSGNVQKRSIASLLNSTGLKLQWILKKYRKEAVDDNFKDCVLYLISEVSTLPSLMAISLVKVEILVFQTDKWPLLVKWSKGHMVLSLGASNSNPAPYVIWCPQVFCK